VKPHGYFVIDRGGTVGWIYRGENQHDRAPLDDVLKAASMAPT